MASLRILRSANAAPREATVPPTLSAALAHALALPAVRATALKAHSEKEKFEVLKLFLTQA